MSKIIEENKLRNSKLDAIYDPYVGIGSNIERQLFEVKEFSEKLYLPLSMMNIPWVQRLGELGSLYDFVLKEGHKHEPLAFKSNAVQLLEDIFLNERLDNDFEFWAAVGIKITNKDTFKTVPFVLRGAQRKLLDALEGMRLSNVPIRIVLLKARQWGGSTLVQFYMMWLQNRHRNNWHLAVCAQDDNAAKNISEMYSAAARSYPESIGTITLKPYAKSSKNRVCVETGGIIGVGSVNNPDQFRSYNFAMAHLCIHPNTEIPTKDGFTKFAKDLSIGDSIITHTGSIAKVSTITISKPNEFNGNGEAVIIKPWGQQQIITTPNHPIFTKNGWVDAINIKKNDFVSYPVRKITDTIKSIQLPIFNSRAHGGGSIPSGSGKTIILNREIGYAFGYYLAEGNIHVSNGEIRELSFTRHDSESKYADRAISAFSEITKRTSRKKRPDTKTTQDFISDVALSTYILSNFKSNENKTIPDWFFDCGEEFLKGVLDGYLCGDGSKSNEYQGEYELCSIRATSISSSIAMQIRDIVVSLGYGLGSVDIKNKGFHYGRNCKKAYTIRWSGSTARKIREMLGWYVPNNGHSYSEKSSISEGFVWIKVREVSKTSIDEVIDIEVDHSDHSFRTISLSVKNSEVGVWQDTPKRSAVNLITSLKETVPDQPYTMVVEESTAKGLNYFHDSWLKAEKGETRYKGVFVAWWEIDRCRIPVKNIDQFYKTMTDYEKYQWELGATIEGIAWYRAHQADKGYSDWMMMQENPATPEEAFQSSGQKVFAPVYIEALRKDNEEPIFQGEVFADSRLGEKAFSNIRFEDVPNGNLRIWEMPDPENKVKNRYVVSVDIGGRTEKADFSVIRVIDRKNMNLSYKAHVKVILSWIGHTDQDLLAWKAAQIATMYDNALLVVEGNALDTTEEGSHFQTVLDQLKDFYRNLYTRNDPEKVGSDYVPKYGYWTTEKSKSLAINTLNAASRERLLSYTDEDQGVYVIEPDKRACDEMSWFETKPNGKQGAIQGKHDDIVMTTAIGLQVAINEMPLPEPKRTEHKRTVNTNRGMSSF